MRDTENYSFKQKSLMGKVLAVLGCFFPFVAFLVIQGYVGYMLSNCIGWVFRHYHVALDGKVSTEQLMGPITTYALFACTLATSVVGAIWYYNRYAARHEIDIRKNAKAKDYGYVVGIAFSFIFVTNIIVAFVVSISPSALSKYNELLESSGMGSEAVMFITAAFIAPIGEECFYRGVMLKKAEKIMPFLWANLLQAALFGIMHMNLIQGSYAFVLGLVIGYVAHKYHSIVMPILLHVAYNIMGQTLPSLTAKLGALPMFGITIVSVVLLIVLLKQVSKVNVIPAAEEEFSVS